MFILLVACHDQPLASATASTVQDADVDTDADADTDTDADTDAPVPTGSTAATEDTVFHDCAYPEYSVPPASLPGWAAVLSQTGADTLGGHGHDDGLGPIGYCPADVSVGDRSLLLVSARFETDEQPPNTSCVVDHTAGDAEHDRYGMCWSGGRHHLYVEVLDEAGVRVEAAFQVDWVGNGVRVEDQDKPPGEFPMNFAMFGGGRYLVTAVYDGLESDTVSNLRIPLNHHVNYLLTFQVVTR